MLKYALILLIMGVFCLGSVPVYRKTRWETRVKIFKLKSNFKMDDNITTNNNLKFTMIVYIQLLK